MVTPGNRAATTSPVTWARSALTEFSTHVRKQMRWGHWYFILVHRLYRMEYELFLLTYSKILSAYH